MASVPDYQFSERWDHNNRAVIRLRGRLVVVRHVSMPAWNKPWFAAWTPDGVAVAGPSIRFTTLLRALDCLYEREDRARARVVSESDGAAAVPPPAP